MSSDDDLQGCPPAELPIQGDAANVSRAGDDVDLQRLAAGHDGEQAIHIRVGTRAVACIHRVLGKHGQTVLSAYRKD